MNFKLLPIVMRNTRNKLFFVPQKHIHTGNTRILAPPQGDIPLKENEKVSTFSVLDGIEVKTRIFHVLRNFENIKITKNFNWDVKHI